VKRDPTYTPVAMASDEDKLDFRRFLTFCHDTLYHIMQARGMFNGAKIWISGVYRTGLTEIYDIDHMISPDAIVALPLDKVYNETETKDGTLILGI